MEFKDRNKPWMFHDIYESICERNQYILDYVKGGKSYPDLLEMVKQTRWDINVKTRNSEENYFLKKLDQHSNNLSKFWGELNLPLGHVGQT